MKFDKEFLDLLDCYNDKEGVEKLEKLKIKYNRVYDISLSLLIKINGSYSTVYEKKKLTDKVKSIQSQVLLRVNKMDRVIQSYRYKDGVNIPF